MLSVVPRAPLPESPEQIVSNAPELEALPVVAQRVMAMVRDERTTVDQIAALLKVRFQQLDIWMTTYSIELI